MADLPPILTGMTDSFIKILLPLAIIIIVLVIIQWIRSMQNKGGTEIRIVRGPGQ